MKLVIAFFCALLACMPLHAAPPSLDDLLKPQQTGLVTISPSGRYVAVTSRVEGRLMLAIVDRTTLRLVRAIDPEENADIARVGWANDERILLMKAHRGTVVNESFLSPYLIAINVDGSRKRTIARSLMDTLIDDDARLLVTECGRKTSKGCYPVAFTVDNDGVDRSPRLAESPLVNADFVSDRAGRIRFAHGWDDDDVQQLWMHRNGQWEVVNHEAHSGVESTPIGTSRDGAAGFLRTERLDGPDVIERIDFGTGQREVVLSDPLLDPEYIVWSADQSQPIGAAYGLGVPRARFWDGNDPDARVLRQLEEAFPEDAVAFTSGSRDGRFAVVSVWSDRDPGSYYLYDREARKTSLIARSKPWLDMRALAPAKPVEFEARDGAKLHGYLTLPLAATGNPPLVVMPHGGPFGIKDQWFYDEEVQMLASRGYAVLRVNFRGSGGFGRAFMESGFRQWGRRMQDDLADGTRWAMASGLIDPQRMCIWGTSYGGYATLLAVERDPALFRCAVASAAVTDLSLQWKWGDIQRSRGGRNFLERAMGTDAKELAANSPVNHVGRIRSRLMVVHGVLDDRVAFMHARVLRKALDDAGIVYEGYFPSRETHGIHGEENRRTYYNRVLEFMERSLAN